MADGSFIEFIKLLKPQYRVCLLPYHMVGPLLASDSAFWRCLCLKDGVVMFEYTPIPIL
jgi:hypothetical protein